MKRYILSLAAVCLTVLGFTISASRAQEGCAEAAIGLCFPEYVTISALAATTDGYTAIAVAGSDLEVLRLDAEAEIVDRFRLPPPDWLPNAGNMPSIDKLVAGPNGDVMGVGTLTAGNRQYGVVFFLTASGDAQWSTALFVDEQSSVILYSGAYDPSEKRYLAVGRHTDGADSGSCTKWSRGLVLSILESDISSLGAYFEGPAEPGLENRVAYYDIAPTGNRGQFIVTGFATRPNQDGNGCQDNAVAQLVSGGTSSQWNVSSRYQVGSPEANEVAFAAAAADNRTFLIAGQGVDVDSDARAAIISKFSFNNSAPALRHDPFPEDASDSSGGDRYRAISVLKGGSFVVAGSVSESRSARNQGVWRVEAPDLGAPGPLNFVTRDAGSDILATALGNDGRILAVGRHGTDRGDIGWMGFIYGLKIAVDRREPDGSLDLLTPQQARAGSLSLSPNEVASGFGYRDVRVGAGLDFTVNFKVSGQTGLAVSALPLDGDLDLVLLDGSGKVRAISSNLEAAGEFVLADLQPGDYALKVVAVSDVSEYELRIRSGVTLAGPVLDSLNALRPDGRQKLAALLAGSGYELPANADIGFGTGSLSSLLAYYNSFNAVVDAAGVQQFIASASLSAEDE
jgi:hypothetical protein